VTRAYVRASVEARAQQRCEYCQLPQASVELLALPRFHVEHILPKKHGGSDELGNLALACHHCNFFKGANLAGIDSATGAITPLFNPRVLTWHQHFIVHRLQIDGRTDIGRVTATVLSMNRLDRLRLRFHMLKLGLVWPG
jgi:hypothetical protein